jgi:uncharacterized Zn finger protein (UPF0148 family)
MEPGNEANPLSVSTDFIRGFLEYGRVKRCDRCGGTRYKAVGGGLVACAGCGKIFLFSEILYSEQRRRVERGGSCEICGVDDPLVLVLHRGRVLCANCYTRMRRLGRMKG